MSTLTSALYAAILEEDGQAFGSLTVVDSAGMYYVSGDLYSSLEDPSRFVEEWFRSQGLKSLVALSTPKAGLTVSHKNVAVTATEDPSRELDEVSVLHYGLVPVASITPSTEYKRLNFDTVEKVRAAVDVLGFIAPLVLDAHLNVIDGNLRLEVAKRSGIAQVPAIVLNDHGAKAAMLRLVLNRSSEFQRWLHSDVDEYVDAWPQLQPILEPLGFFGNKILPTTYFGNTVLEYRIDEYNEQMKEYSQDVGLAAWAEMQRKRIQEAEEKKQALKAARKPSTAGLLSLFDMEPAEEDFVPVHDAKQEIRANVVEMQELAGEITEAYDAKRKAEMEASGRAWQTSRRTSKKKAADARAEAEAAALGFDDEELGEDLEVGVDEDA